MAYKVKIGQFAKNIESTAQPDTTLWPEYDVVFKNGADISNPQITISATYANVQNANYAYMLGRYYWITAKNLFRENYIILQLRVDVLATYKTEIGSSNLYILRSSAAYTGAIRDNYYPVMADKTVSAVIMEDYPYTTFSGGVYVIAVAGNNTGASTLYQLSPASFTTLINQLLGTIDNTTFADVIEAIKNSLFEPMRYINSVMWFPDSFPISGSTTVKIGKWESGVSAGIVSNTVKTLYNKTVTIPKHPQASSRGAYLNCAPYSQYVLEFDPFGTINLDTSQLADISSLNIQVWVDALTGQGTLKVRGSGGDDATACLASITTQLGVPLRITSDSAGSGAVSGVAAVAGLAVGIATANPVAIAGAGISGISSITDAITGSVSNVGSAGSIAANSLTKVLNAVFYSVADEDNTRNGRPYCKVTTPATLGGYMIASKGDVVMSGPLPEHEEVKRYLETGFFYE